MYARLLERSQQSVFLFGARGTGKSTWIRKQFPDATTYNLLDSREALRLARDPRLLSDELRAKPPEEWVVLDEVQKVPALLEEVQDLMESAHLRFVLCGSSARKLKRGGANLLAGRAKVTHMFPLVSAELGEEFNPSKAMIHGTLPLAVTGGDPEGFLSTYAVTYLDEEIRAEALTRNVGAFSRFLEIASRQSGQMTSVSNISREAGVARATVQTYFDVLVDTLIGYWVPAWQLKRSTRQYSHPKFYLFDTGVARALSGRLPYPPTHEEQGLLFETLIFNEVRAYLSYSNLLYQPYFWRTYDGTEVDLLCETRDCFVAVEMKSVTSWLPRYSRGLTRIAEELHPSPVQRFGVYLGERFARSADISILPVQMFLRMLWEGQIIR